MKAEALLALCASRDTRLIHVLQTSYGTNSSLIESRTRLLAKVLRAFLSRFGDIPLRVFRCPGRINLRGMHVDTHGGYLNLMTHQREVLLAAAPREDDRFILANIESQFEDVHYALAEWARMPAFTSDWHAFITHPDVQGPALQRRGHWGNYLKGASLRLQQHERDTPLRGIQGIIGSDLPRGASLSSSTALSMVVLHALAACNELPLDPETSILLGKEAEWFTGARGGMSDQAAMVLGDRGRLVNVALLPGRLDVSGARHVSFPEDLCALVINSYTERSLSGAQLVEYTRNRFAYSMAMEIVRQELARMHPAAGLAESVHYLSDLTPSRLGPGSEELLYRLLLSIPEEEPIDGLRTRYDLPQLDALYDQYFGTAPEELRPRSIRLRGPLLFGIAESERARLFPDALLARDSARAGHFMRWGHDGDRVRNADGTPYRYEVGDESISALMQRATPIEECPGAYGASSPALDLLVDAAHRAGALGASLTGAGIAGTLLALCKPSDTEVIADAVRAMLASEHYATTAALKRALTTEELENAAVPNVAVAPLGELVFT
ncbi:MAG: hypothetical protein IT364_05040 [Candidatus Hydrogenedentes bacterium]|nr:hypothetical protein [Candidatus Hydrogenedentota bacterium]